MFRTVSGLNPLAFHSDFERNRYRRDAFRISAEKREMVQGREEDQPFISKTMMEEK